MRARNPYSFLFCLRAGFSLVELAVVLVIIGIIIAAGVLKGRDLIENARLKRVISEVHEIQMALNSFLDRYDALSGDFQGASTLIAASLPNGNGNLIIEGSGLDTTAETFHAWAHLVGAHFYEKVSLEDLAPEFGRGAPASSLGGAYTIEFNPKDLKGHWIILEKNGAHGDGGLLTPNQAHTLVQKRMTANTTQGACRPGMAATFGRKIASHPKIPSILKMKILFVSFISRYREGFSLLEMAIVLVIIGVLSGMMLPLMTLQRQHDNITRTRTHQDYVMHALGGYLLPQKQLPWPADPVAVSSESGIGKESLTQEIIPFRTLGIPEQWARDGFGHYIAPTG